MTDRGLAQKLKVNLPTQGVVNVLPNLLAGLGIAFLLSACADTDPSPTSNETERITQPEIIWQESPEASKSKSLIQNYSA